MAGSGEVCFFFLRERVSVLLWIRWRSLMWFGGFWGRLDSQEGRARELTFYNLFSWSVCLCTPARMLACASTSGTGVTTLLWTTMILVLITEFRSYTRSLCALNCGAISVAPSQLLRDFLTLSVLSASLCTMCIQCLRRLKEGVGSSEAEATDHLWALGLYKNSD